MAKDTMSAKVARVIAGEQVVVSNKEYDTLCEILGSNDRFWDNFGKYLASLPNPAQVGTKDSLVAFLKKPVID